MVPCILLYSDESYRFSSHPVDQPHEAIARLLDRKIAQLPWGENLQLFYSSDSSAGPLNAFATRLLRGNATAYGTAVLFDNVHGVEEDMYHLIVNELERMEDPAPIVRQLWAMIRLARIQGHAWIEEPEIEAIIAELEETEVTAQRALEINGIFLQRGWPQY